jgi:hypothetical protein
MAALVVVVDPGSTKSYANEVEYAKAEGHKLQTGKQHRCNDRVEDFVQVRASCACVAGQAALCHAMQVAMQAAHACMHCAMTLPPPVSTHLAWVNRLCVHDASHAQASLPRCAGGGAMRLCVDASVCLRACASLLARPRAPATPLLIVETHPHACANRPSLARRARSSGMRGPR